MKVPRLRRSGVSKKWTQAEPMRWVGTRLPEKVPGKSQGGFVGGEAVLTQNPRPTVRKEQCLYFVGLGRLRFDGEPG